MLDIRITDNSNAILDELSHKVENALTGVGFEAERAAKRLVPTDTARLKNSITFATKTMHSEGNSDIKSGETPADPPEYATKAQAEKGTVYLGTNVSYAPSVEFRSVNHRTGQAHFLRDAIANNQDLFKRVIEAALK